MINERMVRCMSFSWTCWSCKVPLRLVEPIHNAGGKERRVVVKNKNKEKQGKVPLCSTTLW